jgi:hypothetical protein
MLYIGKSFSLEPPNQINGRVVYEENGQKTPSPFSTFTFEYENESENGKAGHENEREFTEYREFRKRTNSSEIISNTVDIQKFNTEYRPTVHNN